MNPNSLRAKVFLSSTTALAAAFLNCANGQDDETGIVRPAPFVQPPDYFSSKAATPRRTIQPGHSLDVDREQASAAVEQPSASAFASQVKPASIERRDPPMYLVPPAPLPAPDARLKSVPVPPPNKPVKSSPPPSPDLASPFSLRGLYERLRPGANRQKDAAQESASQPIQAPGHETVEHATIERRLDPVALGFPEEKNPVSRPAARPSFAVQQACPSCFQQPFRADETAGGYAAP